MKHALTTNRMKLFEPLIASAAVQAAMMVLRPGQSSSEDVEDEHPRAEQWLFVISGAGTAKVGRRTAKLKAGSLLLIEHDEPHQITNTGRDLMRTVNFYAPPAYTPKGNVRAAARGPRTKPT